MVFCLAGAWSQAARADFFSDLIGKDDDADFVESSIVLPDAPKTEDLVPFYVSPMTQFRFSVDTHSISIGTDGVVHYTMVARSDQGARNVSFEGIRCDAREFKVYAYLGANDAFRPRADPTWGRIDEAEANRQRASLYKDYFCTSGKPGSVVGLVRKLKTNPYDTLGP